MEPKGQVSPDGQWYWDGGKWLSTLSPDGLWRWDGRSWLAAVEPAASMSLMRGLRRIPGLRTGAAWKLAVAGIATLLLLAAIGAAGAPPAATSSGQPVAQVHPSSPTSADTRTASPSHSPIASPSPSPSHLPSTSPTPAPSPTPQAVPAPAPPPPPAPPAPPASQDPYPAATAAGASAVCADGTLSYSKTRSGTCSHHGGVHWWTGNLGPAGPGNH
jgi:hypothetical protein